MTFKIGTTLMGMQELPTLFGRSGVFDPDYSFQPFATSIDLADGTRKGQGFPRATWRFNHLEDEDRDAIKGLCPNLSALVYIETATNDVDLYGVVFEQYLAVMRWTPEDEDKAAGHTLGIVIEFTHLIAQ